ncbi:MAG: hypothetical protein FJ098_05155 [Deltaproteobacteria bacterium]|nr:hypothetical protein [Deltaproteobacteria bacterium]
MQPTSRVAGRFWLVASLALTASCAGGGDNDPPADALPVDGLAPDLPADGASNDLLEDTGRRSDTASDLASELEGEMLFREDGVQDSAAELSSDLSPDLPTDAFEELPPPDALEGDTPPETPWVVPPLAVCAASGDPCAAQAVAPQLWACYRKDYYLPDADYNEYTAPPVNGGRFHLAGIAAAGGAVTQVLLNGVPMEEMLVEPLVEWYHVWPREVVAGMPLWVAFHSRSPSWDQPGAQGQLQVETTGGVALAGTFQATQAPAPLTYVTTSEDLTELLIHLRNEAGAPLTLSRLLVNGRDATEAACIPSLTLADGATARWTVPLCPAAAPGDPWTVVAEWQGGPPSVGVGRILRPFFPIETWPNTSDCPFPGGDQSNLEKHLAAGFDTHYIYWGNDCAGAGTVQVHEALLQAPLGLHLLIGDDFLDQGGDPATALPDTTWIVGFLTGDESDGEIYDDDGVPNASKKAARSRQLWQYYPELTTYNGGKTNGHVGGFAGMSDVQGMDLYAAACAPHITQWGKHPPLRGPYDYLRNTRNNHMPLPTWLYAQGLSPVWNKDALIGGGTIHVQPDPQEILVQALSVMAAGGKGLMWFQTNMDEADYAPARWEAIGEANALFRAVRPWLREGDLIGATVDDPALAIADAIRAGDAIVVPVINLKTSAAPTDIACGAALVAEFLVPHWVLASHGPMVTVEIPGDFGVQELFEVRADGTQDMDWEYSVQGRELTLGPVPLDNADPVRVLVLAADPSVRNRVEQLLGD